MKLLSLLSLAVLAKAQYPATENIPATLDLDTLGNNSLYLRWRPTYHVATPGGHMNDPCGPMYDNNTKTYHVFYQAFPQHTQFGNTSWSHVVSTDGMVTWSDVADWRNRSMLAIAPSPYPSRDWLGAFSGGAQAVNLQGESDGTLTLMYTGDTKFPDNWKKPYAPYTEAQFIATSSDGGETWDKWPGNPFLIEPPGNWNLTGWRDPIFEADPELDKILGQTEPHHYMVFGSGIRGQDGPNYNHTEGAGPRIPLYTAPSRDLTNWTFQGALFEPPQNFSFGGDATKTGNWGYNFEMSGLFSMVEETKNGGDGDTRHWVLCMGAEGYEDLYHSLNHWSLFAFGNVAPRANGSLELNIEAAGVLDWGNLYALNQFYDPVKDRRIVWGWSDEEMGNYGVKALGYVGALGVPREIFMMKTHNVSAPVGGIVEGADTWEEECDGQYAVTTLGQKPAFDVIAGIQAECNATCVGSMTVQDKQKVEGFQGDRYHLRTTIKDYSEVSEVGISLRATPDDEEFTNFAYFPANNTVVLDRSRSSLIERFNKTAYIGHLTPYTFSDGTTQSLTIDLFVDNSLLELFINDRFSMTARVYPSRIDATGLSFYALGGNATFEDTKYWDSMINVFPNRPLNASSPLVFDPYYETHITFENDYVPVGTKIYDGY